MDLKNTLAAVSLSAAIIVLWGLFFAPEPRQVKEGQLEKEEGAVAAVIGCHNSSKTLLTISSSQVPGGILDLSLIGGITYNLELNNQT